ncbi:MAG: hypothetical protein ABW101_09170 [Candidatus Thiodiazotropha sp.]
MRVFFIALIIGIVKIVAISKLYQEIGLLGSIYLYVAGTSIGGLVLFFNWKEAKAQYEEVSNIDKSLVMGLKGNTKGLSSNEKKSLKIICQSILFTIAVIFVFIPGVVSDILGIVLAPLAIRSKLSNFIVKINARDSNA